MLSRANSLIANNNVRGILLEIKTSCIVCYYGYIRKFYWKVLELHMATFALDKTILALVRSEILTLFAVLLNWVVLVHDALSNASRSNDARFMHKLYINYIFLWMS